MDTMIQQNNETMTVSGNSSRNLPHKHRTQFYLEHLREMLVEMFDKGLLVERK